MPLVLTPLHQRLHASNVREGNARLCNACIHKWAKHHSEKLLCGNERNVSDTSIEKARGVNGDCGPEGKFFEKPPAYFTD